MDNNPVGVVGAGTMGNGIAHLFAKSGFKVLLTDIEDRFLKHGLVLQCYKTEASLRWCNSGLHFHGD